MYLYILETEEHLSYYLNNLEKKNNYIATISPAVSEKLKKNKIKHIFYNYNKVYYDLIKKDSKLINNILLELKLLEDKINNDLNLNHNYSVIKLNSYHFNFLISNFWTKYNIYRSLILSLKKKKIKKIFFLVNFYENKFALEKNYNFILAINKTVKLKKHQINIIQVPKKNKISLKINIKDKLKNLLLYFCMTLNNIKNQLLEKKYIKILYLDHTEKKHLITQNKILSYDFNIFSNSTINFTIADLKKNYENMFKQNKILYLNIFSKWLKNLKNSRDVKIILKFLENEIIFLLIIIPRIIREFDWKIEKKLKEIKPDFLFTYSNTSWIENFIILLSKKYKIKTAYIQHGGLFGTALIPKNDFIFSKTDVILTYGKQNQYIKKNDNQILPTGNIELLKKFNFKKNTKKIFSKILYISDGNSLISSIKRKMTDISLFFNQKKILNFLSSLNKYEISYRPWIHKSDKTGIVDYIKENLKNIKIENISNIYSQISENDLIITDSLSAINLYKSIIFNKHIFFIYDENVITYSKRFLSDLKKVAIVTKNIDEIDKILKSIENGKIFNILNSKTDNNKRVFIKKYIFGGKNSFSSYHLYNSLIKL
jgi:hypothetical protein